MKALSGRALAIALLASIALNVALIAALATPWVAGHGHDRGPGFRHGGAVALLRELAGPEAAALGARHEPLLKERMEGVRAARERVLTALAAEPFDRDAFQAALVDLRAASGQAKDAFDAMLGEVIPTLSPEQRRELAERLFRRFPKPDGG